MRLTDDYEDEPRTTLPIVTMSMAGVAVVFVILIIVVLINKEPVREKPVNVPETATQTETSTQETASKQVQEKSVDELISGSKLTSDQLDIWEEPPSVVPSQEKVAQSEPVTEKETEVEDPSRGGTRTKIKNKKGEEEWIPINPYLVKNKYDYTGLVYQAPMMEYFENSTKVSHMGIDVSKNQGYVDYNKLKKQGIEFAMIRLGTRGYGTGKIVLDEYFADNIKGAADAGMRVGISFFSQAITQEEAVEEANVILQNIAGYTISYPIAFDMETIENDTARIDKLTKAEKTKITSAFLKTIKAAGYQPIIYGKKEWLMQQIDLAQLIEYDIWLSQEEDIPDYPYKFSMWQYTTNAKIEGVSGKANLTISFIDYDLK